MARKLLQFSRDRCSVNWGRCTVGQLRVVAITRPPTQPTLNADPRPSGNAYPVFETNLVSRCLYSFSEKERECECGLR